MPRTANRSGIDRPGRARPHSAPRLPRSLRQPSARAPPSNWSPVPPPTVANHQIPIDPNAPARPPRVPSLAAFGRRPQAPLATSRPAGIRNPSHDQPIEASYDRSALRPEADTLNQPVRSWFTPPELQLFQTHSLREPSNSLNYRASNIRTKMAVVRLLRRKWAERDEKRPEVGPRAGPRGSDNLPGMAAVCGIPTADQEQKKNVPTGCLGGARGPVTKTSPARFQ